MVNSYDKYGREENVKYLRERYIRGRKKEGELWEPSVRGACRNNYGSSVGNMRGEG